MISPWHPSDCFFLSHLTSLDEEQHPKISQQLQTDLFIHLLSSLKIETVCSERPLEMKKMSLHVKMWCVTDHKEEAAQSSTCSNSADTSMTMKPVHHLVELYLQKTLNMSQRSENIECPQLLHKHPDVSHWMCVLKHVTHGDTAWTSWWSSVFSASVWWRMSLFESVTAGRPLPALHSLQCCSLLNYSESGGSLHHMHVCRRSIINLHGTNTSTHREH